MFSGAPRSQASRLRKTISARRLMDSWVAKATWGVTRQFLALSRGSVWSRGGSLSNTSMPAPAMTPRGESMDTSLAYFLRQQGLSDEEILEGFQKKGGLLGISGVSNDLRYVLQAADEGNQRAKLAVDVFVSGIVHYIGAFFLDLDRLDYLVFTAGIGEHSHHIRSMVCRKLAPLGVRLDEEKNRNCRGAAVISAEDSAVCVRVIPTDEELGIARRAYEM